MSSATITIYPGTPDSYTIELVDEHILPIGRLSSADGSFKLVLPLPEVSAQHAEIRPSANGWVIQDTGSTNGTKLNGNLLTPGKQYPLLNADLIKIAQVDLLFEMKDKPELTSESATEQGQTFVHIDIINATILVADIKGFTTLMEHYADQPELIMQAASHVFQAISSEILHSHGSIEKIAGDAIMAYWTVESRESPTHAIAACQTALRMRTLVDQLAQDRQSWPFEEYPLKLDFVLTTGPIAARALALHEKNPAVLGDTVNLAFRLEKSISDDNAGDIVVDGATYNLVKDNFVFVELGQFNFKGRQRPVTAYRLIGTQGQNR